MKMSKYIKRQRKIAGLTQEQLAEKMDVTPQAVQNWESGRTRIDWGKLKSGIGWLSLDFCQRV